jgi:hypothetical protein
MDALERLFVVRPLNGSNIIVQQFGVNVEGVVHAANALVKEAQILLKNKVGLDVNKQQRGAI